MNWELLGFSNAEVFGHVWSQSWRFQDFPDGLFGTAQTIGTKTFPLIDPVTDTHRQCIRIVSPSHGVHIMYCFLSLALCAWVMRWIPVSDSEEHPLISPRIVLMLSSPMMWGV